MKRSRNKSDEVRRKNKSHKNKIARDERPLSNGKWEKLPPNVKEEMLKELEQDAGAGLPTDPDDMTWIGGRDSVDFSPEDHLEPHIDDEIGPLGTLEVILLSIIRANPVKKQKSRPSQSTPSDEARLRSVMAALTGEEAKRGRPSRKPNWPILRRVARKYYVASLDLPDNQYNTLRQIVISELFPDRDQGDVDVAAKKDKIDDYYEDFNAYKHKLLVEVAYANDPHVNHSRRSPVIKVVDQMRKLGVRIADPYK